MQRWCYKIAGNTKTEDGIRDSMESVGGIGGNPSGNTESPKQASNVHKLEGNRDDQMEKERK